jgi:nucleoporin SEH1
LNNSFSFSSNKHLKTNMPPSASGTTHGSSTQILSSEHNDYVSAVSFDVYGRRMGTSSGDRFVRVWDLTDSGEWSLVGEWQAHRGSVTMLNWSHPEYGSLIATGGSDHEAKIWEERTNSTSASSRWTAKAQLTEGMKTLSVVIPFG